MNEVISCPICSRSVATEPASFGLMAFQCECGHAGIVGPEDLARTAGVLPLFDHLPRQECQAPQKVTQGKLGLEPGRPTTAIDTREEVIQRHTLHALCHRGYLVL